MSRARRQTRTVARQPEPERLPAISQRILQVARAHGWRVAALWAAALLAYSNSFRTGLPYDNVTLVLDDSRIQSFTARNLGLIFHQEYWYQHSTTGLYRPLTTVSYLVNYTLFGFGTHAAGYHWINLGLHAVNMALVYALGMAIFGEAALAWAVAGLWGLHPVLTEAVTNVAGRADLLAALGVLAGLLCHIRSGSAAGRWKTGWRAGLLASAALGIFSKENAAVLPGLMLLYDLAWTEQRQWRARMAGYVPVAVAFAAYLILRLQMQAHSPIGLIPFGDNPLVDAGFWTARLTALKVIGKYFWLFFWPARLSADYSYNAVPLFGWRLGSWEDLRAVVSLACCAGLAAAALLNLRRRKAVYFFLLFFFVALAPTANLVVLIGSIMAERFLYLPAIGLAGTLGAMYQASGWPRNRVAGAVLGVLLAACAARTFVRNFDWMDERTMAASAVKAEPASFRAHWLLANNLAASDPDGAVKEADQTQAILQPLSPEQLNAKVFAENAYCYRLKGDRLKGEESAQWYRKALATLLRGQQVDDVQTERARQVNLAPGKRITVHKWIPLYLELGRVYLRLSQPDQALEWLAVGRANRPDAEFSDEMARAWLAKGEWKRAAVALLEGMVLDPKATTLAAELLEVYRREAPQTCAVNNGASINLECPLVHDALCDASRNVALGYRQAGQVNNASRTALTAVKNLGCPANLIE